MTQRPTESDLQAAAAMAEIYFRANPGRASRLAGHFARAIAEARRHEVVFVPGAGGAWRLGLPGEVREYLGAPPVLAAAHSAICGERVFVIDYVRRASRDPDGSVRHRLRKATAWVERMTGCYPLVDALRSLRVVRGEVIFVPQTGTPKVITL